MSGIVDIFARQIFDSRGNPTVEVEIVTEEGAVGRAAVPSGASTGEYEAVELRDGNKDVFEGKSVYDAIRNIEEILTPALIDFDVFDQAEIDFVMMELDATENKSKIGANAMLAVSLAVARAAADEAGLPLYKYLGGVGANTLPVPMMNILNGGQHADNNVDFQEFMIMPVGAGNFTAAFQIAHKVFFTLKNILKEKGYSTNVGDEGGFAPNVKSNEEAIELVIEAIEKAEYVPGKDVFIALDPATSEMYNNETKKYEFYKSTKKELTTDQMIDFWADWVEKYPIISIEDGLDENDWEGWKKLNEKLGDKIQLVGDDLFVTNPKRLQKGINEKSANSILIKLNQIGTLTETLNAMNLAMKNGFTAVVSHRSGETEDTFIADLAVALNTGQIKTGSLSRTDRMAKYNQLLRIEEELANEAKFNGKDW